MSEDREIVLLRIDRKTGILMLGVLAVVLGGFTLAEQLTLTTSYPVPSGIYNQLITTGNSGTVAADTTLNRNAGNTILVPPTNGSGNVGIGTASPSKKLVVSGDADVSGTVSGGLVTGGDIKVGPNSVFTQFACSRGVSCTRTGNTLNITACASNGTCSAATPACGTTTTGVDNCGAYCTKTGPTCSCVPQPCNAPTPACNTTTLGTDGCGNVCTLKGDICPGTLRGSCPNNFPVLKCVQRKTGGTDRFPKYSQCVTSCAAGWTFNVGAWCVAACTKL